MARLLILALVPAALAAAIWAGLAMPAEAQQSSADASAGNSRDALRRAESDLRAARMRADALEKQAETADEAADKAARGSAALAARIQQAEAGITAAEARLALIQYQQATLDLRLAERREPLLRLTAALQRLARRPLTLSALKPGSLEDAVYLRAMLATTLPQVERRTRSLRNELAESRKLAGEAGSTLAELERTETELAERRRKLSAMETSQRLASRSAARAARRETERAFALAEETRSLDELVGEFDRAARLRRELALLPGPILRPPRPDASQVMSTGMPDIAQGNPRAIAGYRLPVAGRMVSGFAARNGSSQRTQGIVLAPRPRAAVVAPARGRVAFAGPYRGYGRIVIIEHADGWTSLVTGLGRSELAVGEELLAGAPLGFAAAANPRITLELRRAGTPVNPLAYLE